VLNLKLYRMLAVMFVLVFGGVKFAKAQSGDVYFGMGTDTDSSNGQIVQTYGPPTNYSTPEMTGLFGKFGAGYMFKPTLGFGGEYNFRFSQGSYAGLNYRPKFYDLNVIWMPLGNSRKVVPEFQGGIGGVNLSFYYSSQYCDLFAGCTTSNSYLEGSSHFQTHLSAGLRFYVKGGMFVRPQFDVHYVNNFFQFGRGWVPEYGVVIGYTFGRQ
jgi:hypothetical protein